MLVYARAFAMTGYAELVSLSNFSFLRGVSHPEELVIQAKTFGLSAIALCDRNSLAGVVRAHGQAKKSARGLPMNAATSGGCRQGRLV